VLRCAATAPQGGVETQTSAEGWTVVLPGTATSGEAAGTIRIDSTRFTGTFSAVRTA